MAKIIDANELDRLATKHNMNLEGPLKIKAGVLFALSKLTADGSTCFPYQELCEIAATELLDLPIEEIEDQLLSLIRDGILVSQLVAGREMIFKPDLYAAEWGIAAGLLLLDKARVKPILADKEGVLRRLQMEEKIAFSNKQLETIISVSNHNVSIVTGGPGTGKTTIIKGIGALLKASGEKTVICAPTGRAAKRIKEATGYPALTVHRLLEAEFDEDTGQVKFRRNQAYPLDYDAVIVDESSMLDVVLMLKLVDALSPGTRLILSGDANQLPAVGPGNVLRDIINSDIFPVYFLKTIYRQAEESLIVSSAHGILEGEIPENGGPDRDLRIIEISKQDLLMEELLSLAEGDFQLISMTKRGPFGTQSLNEKLQERLNPPGKDKNQIKVDEKRIFREGDKLMQIKNNYSIRFKSMEDFSEGSGIFNGEIGFVAWINLEEKRMAVLFDEGRYAEYEEDMLNQLDLAYAITVHKSQGSEFDKILMPLVHTSAKLANRNLLYTALTRAKDLAVFVGSPKLLKNMVDNNKEDMRQTGLRGFLQTNC